jgi:hypothetical protein
MKALQVTELLEYACAAERGTTITYVLISVGFDSIGAQELSE